MRRFRIEVSTLDGKLSFERDTVSLSTSIEGESLDYRTWNVRAAPELPSRIVIMKNWHRTCFLPLDSFFCSTPQSHSSVPPAFHPGHCVSGSQGWPPPSAATASAARSVLDGREHGGTLSRIGDDLPNSASRILYSLRERELEVHGTPACAAIEPADEPWAWLTRELLSSEYSATMDGFNHSRDCKRGSRVILATASV